MVLCSAAIPPAHAITRIQHEQYPQDWNEHYSVPISRNAYTSTVSNEYNTKTLYSSSSNTLSNKNSRHSYNKLIDDGMRLYKEFENKDYSSNLLPFLQDMWYEARDDTARIFESPLSLGNLLWVIPVVGLLAYDFVVPKIIRIKRSEPEFHLNIGEYFINRFS